MKFMSINFAKFRAFQPMWRVLALILGEETEAE